MTATATATVTLTNGAARVVRFRPGLYVALAAFAVVVAVALHAGASPRALVIAGLIVAIVVMLAAIAAIVALVLCARGADDPPPIGLPIWAYLTPGVEVTDHRRVVGRNTCAACGVPAVRVIRGPSGLHLPVCGLHMTTAADYLRALTGGPR